MVIAIDNFFGCYLLYCKNPKFKGRTYIGFTVNPERRIGQHNAGKHKGGAWKTSGKGPWDMALILHGFPSDIAALRFEWAWQNPDRSRRLRHVKSKSRKESSFQFRVRVMASMLCQTPWKKLPIVVRWLKQEYAIDLEHLLPSHMPIAYGPVTAKVKKHKSDLVEDVSTVSMVEKSQDKSKSDDEEEFIPLLARIKAAKTKFSAGFSATKTAPSESAVHNSQSIQKDFLCFLCSNTISSETTAHCLRQNCTMTSHLTCLAKHFLLNERPFQLLPVEGTCPKCKSSLIWGDLIRESQGFHQYLTTQK